MLSTGSELRDPGDELGHDSIYDGNSYLLSASVLRAGATPRRVGIIPDEPDAFVATLREQLAGADLVVTSGGVSQGDYDVVKEALREQGVWFGPVAMQPGKPQGFGVDRRRPGRHAARQLRVGVHLLRGLRPARHPHAARQGAGVPDAARRPADQGA